MLAPGLVVSLLLCGAAEAQDLSTLLAKGEVNLLETLQDGRLRQVTTIALVRAPLDTVWATLTDFDAYESWMPQVSQAEVVGHEAGAVLVDWGISVVGPDVNFRGKYVLDPVAHTITGTWVSGAMAGSRWDWRLEAVAQGTILYRTVRVNIVDSSWVLRQVEDTHHTMDYGINSAIGVVEVRGVKARLAVR